MDFLDGIMSLFELSEDQEITELLNKHLGMQQQRKEQLTNEKDIYESLLLAHEISIYQYSRILDSIKERMEYQRILYGKMRKFYAQSVYAKNLLEKISLEKIQMYDEMPFVALREICEGQIPKYEELAEKAEKRQNVVKLRLIQNKHQKLLEMREDFEKSLTHQRQNLRKAVYDAQQRENSDILCILKSAKKLAELREEFVNKQSKHLPTVEPKAQVLTEQPTVSPLKGVQTHHEKPRVDAVNAATADFVFKKPLPKPPLRSLAQMRLKNSIGLITVSKAKKFVPKNDIPALRRRARPTLKVENIKKLSMPKIFAAAKPLNVKSITGKPTTPVAVAQVLDELMSHTSTTRLNVSTQPPPPLPITAPTTYNNPSTLNFEKLKITNEPGDLSNNDAATSSTATPLISILRKKNEDPTKPKIKKTVTFVSPTMSSSDEDSWYEFVLPFQNNNDRPMQVDIEETFAVSNSNDFDINFTLNEDILKTPKKKSVEQPCTSSANANAKSQATLAPLSFDHFQTDAVPQAEIERSFFESEGYNFDDQADFL